MTNPLSPRNPAFTFPGALCGVHVVIVERLSAATEPFHRILEKDGATVTTVPSVLDAVDALMGAAPAMLLVDLETATEHDCVLVRSITTERRIAAVALTPSPEHWNRALGFGFHACLPRGAAGVATLLPMLAILAQFIDQ
jgi:CheY-like chemotaxis protein